MTFSTDKKRTLKDFQLLFLPFNNFQRLQYAFYAFPSLISSAVPLNLEFYCCSCQDCKIVRFIVCQKVKVVSLIAPKCHISMSPIRRKEHLFSFPKDHKRPCSVYSSLWGVWRLRPSPTSQSIFRDASPFLIVLLSLVVYNRSPFWYSLLVLCQRIYMRQLSKESV